MLLFAKRHFVRPFRHSRRPLVQQPFLWFGTDDSQSTSNVEEYLSSLGILEDLHKEVLQSVKNVVGEDKELTLKTLEATFTKADLIDLSSALKQQQKKRRRKSPRLKREVVFCTPNQNRTTLTWKQGESLLALSQSIAGQRILDGLDQMGGPCGGQMSCSTCHVYLDPKTFKALPSPVDEELDMIDLAFETQRNITARMPG